MEGRIGGSVQKVREKRECAEGNEEWDVAET
jgi:hypothetical protein